MARSYKRRKETWAFKKLLQSYTSYSYEVEIPDWYPNKDGHWYQSYYLTSWIKPGTQEFLEKKRKFHCEKKDYLNALSSESSSWRRTNFEKPYRQKSKKELINWLKFQNYEKDWDISPPGKGPRENYYF